MDPETFHHWLDSFANAWELREPRAVAPLLAEDVIFHETPFSEPILGREAMIVYLEKVYRTQNDPSFDYEILTETPDIGIAQWWLSFLRIPGRVHINRDGIALVALDSRGLCKTFHQWWHEQEVVDEP